jgi:hypothetical protein
MSNTLAISRQSELKAIQFETSLWLHYPSLTQFNYKFLFCQRLLIRLRTKKQIKNRKEFKELQQDHWLGYETHSNWGSIWAMRLRFNTQPSQQPRSACPDLTNKLPYYIHLDHRGRVVGIVTRIQTGRLKTCGSILERARNCLYSKVLRLDLGSTRPPIKG